MYQFCASANQSVQLCPEVKLRFWNFVQTLMRRNILQIQWCQSFCTKFYCRWCQSFIQNRLKYQFLCKTKCWVLNIGTSTSTYFAFKRLLRDKSLLQPNPGVPLEPWRPLATLGDHWRHDWKWPISPKMVIFKHVAKGRQGSPRAAKGFQGPRGTPGMGEMSFNQIDHI